MPPNSRTSRTAQAANTRTALREGKRLTESFPATLSVATAVLKAKISDGNFYYQGVNTSYPNAELFETHFTDAGPSVEVYVDRWLTYTRVDRSFVFVALTYIQRVSETWSSFMLTKWNFHRIFAASAIVASKLLDEDQGEEHLAQVAGLESVRLMHGLEHAFLNLLRNKRHVSRRRRREAEAAFIREALNSSRGSSVARVLQEEQIEELD